MGRDWYYKSSGSNKSAVRRSRTSSTVEKETHLGCISSVFHFFDLHQFQCVFSGAAHDHQHEQHPPDINPAVLRQRQSTTEANKNSGSLSDDHHTPPPKGVEAPRNSLELQEGPSSSSSSAMKEEDDDSTIPFSALQVLVPLKSSSSSSDREAKENQRSSSSPFSDDTNSQGSKTPNLVARLMGLDLLPAHHEILSATSSPLYRRSSIGKFHHQSHHQQSHKENNAAPLMISCSRYESGTRSLPDTPRISSARRSDVAPRLSLQVLNRDEVPSREAVASSSPVSARRRRRRRDMKLMKVYEESKTSSPSKYAKEMVKQVKESVSRKFGADITNTTASTSPYNTGRGDTRSDCDERIHSPTGVLKLRKINTGNAARPPETTTSSLQSKHTSCTAINAAPSSRSPRFRVISKQKSGSVPKPAENLTHKPQIPEFSHNQSKPVPTYYSETLKASKSKTTQISSSSPLPKPTTKCKKASCERFTRKPKKAPPSETIENFRAESLPRNSKVQQGGAVVARSNQEASPPSCSAAAALGVRDDNGAVEAEFRYVRAILERRIPGIETRWYSSSSSPCRHRPLDRSLFQALEQRHGRNWYSPPPAGPIGLKSYRALLFDLADEVLAGLLAKRPPPASELVEAVWGRMKNGFPGANCKTLQDIDALVGSDMGPGGGALEEEVELVAAEIEREVVESLVAETAAGMRAR